MQTSFGMLKVKCTAHLVCNALLHLVCLKLSVYGGTPSFWCCKIYTRVEEAMFTDILQLQQQIAHGHIYCDH